jgi:serine/threonine protein kinase
MTPDRWQHIDALLQEVMNQPPAIRAAVLHRLCANDPSAREEIESLISFRELANSFLETPVTEAFPELLFEARESLIGQTLGTYTIEAQLGFGGMGEVYLARDAKLERKVAIKVLPVEIEPDERSERLIREAKAAARLDHPNICAIYEVAESGDHSFIVMQYIEGETLASWIQGQPLGLHESIRIIAQVADALSEAHSQGIIHRDIKPLNIMVTPRGQAKVLDFGLAKMIGLAEVALNAARPQSALSAPGIIPGTAPYMSPEQALGSLLDTRSDLFSLGTVLYECVTGTRPFTGATAVEICEKVAYVTPPPPSQLNPKVPPELDKVILKALAKEPIARYQTASEFREDILHIHIPGEAGQTTRWWRFLLVAAALGLLAIILYVAWPWIKPPHIPKAEAQSLYKEGLNASGIGAYYTASQKFEQAIQEDELFALAHARLADVCSALGYADRANAEWVKASSLVLDRSGLSKLDRLALDAIVKTLSRDPSGAIDSYREILENASEPDKARAHFDLARAYERKKENHDAILHYQAATTDALPNPGALLRLGVLYREQDRQKAGEQFDNALKAYADKGYQEGSVEVILQRWALYRDAGKPRDALAQLDHAYDLAKDIGNKNQQVRSLLLMSRLLKDQQELDNAEAQAERAMRIAQQAGAQELSTEALLEISDLLRELGKYDEALAQLEEALVLSQHNKESLNEGRALMLIATVYIDLHQTNLAQGYIDDAIKLAEQTGSEERKWFLQYLRADALDLNGDSLSAENSHSALLAEAEERDWPLRVATSYQALSLISAHRGRLPEALQRSKVCYEKYQLCDSTTGRIDSLMIAAEILCQLGRFADANKELTLTSSIVSLPVEERTIRSAKIARVRFRWEMSQGILPEAVNQGKLTSSLNPSNDPSIEVEIKSALGLALSRSGRTDKGIALCFEAVDLATQRQMPPWLSSPAKLALAEALLLGRYPGALAKVDEAIGEFSSNDNLEFQWRALVIAARASRLLGNNSTARVYALRAQESLSSLRMQWGDADYSNYATRKDNKALMRHLSALLRS